MFPRLLSLSDGYFDPYSAVEGCFSLHSLSIKKNPGDLSLMTKYLDYLGKYESMLKKFEDLEDSKMSDEEALYYAEVQLRINQKLLQSLQ